MFLIIKNVNWGRQLSLLIWEKNNKVCFFMFSLFEVSQFYNLCNSAIAITPVSEVFVSIKDVSIICKNEQFKFARTLIYITWILQKQELA